VKTIFAMPLFDWDNPSVTHVTNKHFWVYWAVTGPLTLSTMALVITWALWNRSNLRAEIWRASKDVDVKSSADNSSSNKEELPVPENIQENAQPTDIERQRKWHARAILKRRHLWRKTNIKKTTDPENPTLE